MNPVNSPDLNKRRWLHAAGGALAAAVLAACSPNTPSAGKADGASGAASAAAPASAASAAVADAAGATDAAASADAAPLPCPSLWGTQPVSPSQQAAIATITKLCPLCIHSLFMLKTLGATPYWRSL